MELIDEIKKLRDECVEDEEFYRDVSPWLEASPWRQTNKKIIQEIIRIRRKLDKIIFKYEPEPVKHAHWIEGNEDHVSCDSVCYYTCSECNHSFSDNTPYCPNCGARMDGEVEGKSKK